MSCEYCQSYERTVCSVEDWEDGFVRTAIRFYTGNNGTFYLGADTITKDGQKYNTCKRVPFCPMCGDPLESPEALTLEQLKSMIGDPVWTTHHDGSGGKWGIVQYDSTLGLSAVVSCDEERWFEMKAAEKPLAYARKPKREG